MRGAIAVMVAVLPACVDAWAQPRRGIDAGVRVRDAGRDVGSDVRVRARDAGSDARSDARARDVGVDVVMRPVTHGSVDAQVARRTLATRNQAVRQCYEHELARDATLRGEITVRLRVEEDGSVSETSTGGDPALLRVGRCIENELRTLRFPRPTGGPATVAAPFVFAQGE